MVPNGTQSLPHKTNPNKLHHDEGCTGYCAGKFHLQPEQLQVTISSVSPYPVYTVSVNNVCPVHDDGHSQLSAQQSVRASRKQSCTKHVDPLALDHVSVPMPGLHIEHTLTFECIVYVPPAHVVHKAAPSFGPVSV